MTTKEQFKGIIVGLKNNWTEPNFLPDTASYETWFQCLKDLDYEVLRGAVLKCIMTMHFPPKIADIREKAAEITGKNEVGSELEAWSLVGAAIRDSAYHSEERFAELPEAVQQAVGSPSVLREWSQMPAENLSVTQSQFLRSYRCIEERRKQNLQLSTEVREHLRLTADGMNGIVRLERKDDCTYFSRAKGPEPEFRTADPERMDALRKMLGAEQ